MFNKLNLHPIYDSSELSIMNDLIVPILTHSVDYYRGVGFFTSGWLRVAAKGLTQLIQNGGTAKIVLSPLLQRNDWEAIVAGEEARRCESLKHSLRISLDEIEEKLEKDTLNTLAWMVSDGLLEFKFAVPKESVGGDYHDKVGWFVDHEGNEVAIHGSFNDTIKGTLNGEAFSVFKSWELGQLPYVEKHKVRLFKLWNNENTQFAVYGIPDAIKKRFITYRSSERPYVLTPIASDDTPSGGDRIALRGYQHNAINCWFANDRKGIYEMATGTGKTFTALATAKKAMVTDGKQALVILVPYIHLLDQWKEDAEEFGYLPILCSGQHNDWPRIIRSKIQDYNIGCLNKICIIAVHQTGACDKFTNAISKIRKNSMLIADEVHRLGAGGLKHALKEAYQYRLGLSATPRRWFDEIGTQIIFNYFNDVCYQYGLSEAIENEYLTPYDYNPVLIELNVGELNEYEQLTDRIISLASQLDNDPEAAEKMKLLLLKRTRLIANAANKVPVLIQLLKDAILLAKKKGEEPKHILIYCAPGKHKEILQIASGLGLRCHEFVHTVSLKDRKKVLKDFSEGHIQALIAVKCLDEGVDVPATQTAFILASSTNPMEYVQRRGRILRRSEKKNNASVYDFIVTPSANNPIVNKFEGVLRREMPRFVEFASLARNKFEARSKVRNMLNKNGLLDLLDRFPWDIYKEAQSDMLNDAE